MALRAGKAGAEVNLLDEMIPGFLLIKAIGGFDGRLVLGEANAEGSYRTRQREELGDSALSLSTDSRVTPSRVRTIMLLFHMVL